MTRVEQYRQAAGIPLSGPPPIPCFGACGGVAGWKDPETGFPCSLCSGSGSLSYQQKHDAEEWDKARATQREHAEKAQQKRAAAQPMRTIQGSRASSKAETAARYAAEAAALVRRSVVR